jgi:putative intracellular protease/amidase
MPGAHGHQEFRTQALGKKVLVIAAANCHAPWLLVETGIAKGKRMTSYHSRKTDVINAGAAWEDWAVVADKAS